MTLDPSKDPSCVLAFDWSEPSGSVAYDLSKHGNNGTIYGAVRQKGILNHAVGLDGIDDRILVENNNLLNVQQGNIITIECWAYLTGWMANRLVGVLIDKRTENIANYNWEYNSSVMYMRIHADNAKWIVKVPHELFRWNHYVMVLSGSVLRGYVNGKLRDERNDVPNTVGNTVSLHIGCSIYADYFSKGLIGSIRIYDKALSDEEIVERYYYGKKQLSQIRFPMFYREKRKGTLALKV